MDKLQFENLMREKDTTYSEYFAQALLALVYDDFFALSKRSESPDIQLDLGEYSHGVEVTRLICSYFVTLKKYTKAWAKQRLSMEQIIERMPYELKNSVGVNSVGKVVPLKSLGEKIGVRKMTNQVLNIVQAKTEKLQHYEPFKKNSLFIFATELNPNITTKKLMSAFVWASKKSEYKKQYNNIFVFTYKNLHCFNIEQNHYGVKSIPVDDTTISTCDKYARNAKRQNFQNYLQQHVGQLEK